MARKAGASGPWLLSQHDKIHLYVPNLIGYARVALALAAYCVALRHPARTVFLYSLSFVCDELDGRAARAFGQSSTLGAVLDMVTDRVATTCLLAVVGALYGAACPAALLCALALVALDVSSHWFGMYASLRCGEASHKESAQHRSLLVRLYYQHRLFMGACCVACEVLYLCLYLLAWPEQFGVGGRRSVPVPVPGWGAALLRRAAGSQASLPGPLAAALRLAARRREVPLAAVVAALSVPLWLTKQVCNWLQLRSAMDRLVEWDLEARRRIGREALAGGGRRSGGKAAAAAANGGGSGGVGPARRKKGLAAAAAAADSDSEDEAEERRPAANGRGRSRSRGGGGGASPDAAPAARRATTPQRRRG